MDFTCRMVVMISREFHTKTILEQPVDGVLIQITAILFPKEVFTLKQEETRALKTKGSTETKVLPIDFKKFSVSF